MYLTSDFGSNQTKDWLKLSGYQTWPEGLEVRKDKVNRQADRKQAIPESRAVDACSFFLTTLLFSSGVTMLIVSEKIFFPSQCCLAKGWADSLHGTIQVPSPGIWIYNWKGKDLIHPDSMPETFSISFSTLILTRGLRLNSSEACLFNFSSTSVCYPIPTNSSFIIQLA